MTANKNDFSHADGVSLKAYVDEICDSQCRQHDICRKDIEERFRAQTSALEQKENALALRLEIAAGGLEKRLEAMNEIRGALKDAQTQMITRPEHTIMMDKYDAEIRSLRESRAVLEGKASQKSVNLALSLTVISIMIAITSIIVAIVLH